MTPYVDTFHAVKGTSTKFYGIFNYFPLTYEITKF